MGRDVVWERWSDCPFVQLLLSTYYVLRPVSGVSRDPSIPGDSVHWPHRQEVRVQKCVRRRSGPGAGAGREGGTVGCSVLGLEGE